MNNTNLPSGAASAPVAPTQTDSGADAKTAKLATKLQGVWVFMPDGSAADIVGEAVSVLKAFAAAPKADQMHAYADATCAARGAAQAAPAPVAHQYICPVRTVADLVNNLMLMEQTLPIYGAQYIEHRGGRRAIAVAPTVSRERVKDGRWIGDGDTLNAAIIWTRAEQPAPVAEDALHDMLEKILEGMDRKAYAPACMSDVDKIGKAHIAARAQQDAEVCELMTATRAALKVAADNPSKAAALPENLKVEWVKFMAGEPSLFDRVPFGEMKALGAARAQAAQPEGGAKP